MTTDYVNPPPLRSARSKTSGKFPPQPKPTSVLEQLDDLCFEWEQHATELNKAAKRKHNRNWAKDLRIEATAITGRVFLLRLFLKKQEITKHEPTKKR